MNLFLKKMLLLLVLAGIALMSSAVSASVLDTKHNLAHWSPYAYRATTENRVCIFCHTPHNASPAGALWSHELTAGGTTFKKYSSGTLKILGIGAANYQSSGDETTITGATKLCLGCHDGLTALGAITTGGGSMTIDMEVANLGSSSSGYNDAGTVNIQNKHPVSFNYDATVVVPAINTAKGGSYYAMPGDAINGTSANNNVKKMVDYAGGKVECTICHDPHENYATSDRNLLPFWVSGSYNAGALGNLSSYEGVCISCHSVSFGEYTFYNNYTSLR